MGIHRKKCSLYRGFGCEMAQNPMSFMFYALFTFVRDVNTLK